MDWNGLSFGFLVVDEASTSVLLAVVCLEGAWERFCGRSMVVGVKQWGPGSSLWLGKDLVSF